MKTLETTPPGETHWSTRSMAKAASVRFAFQLNPSDSDSENRCTPIQRWWRLSAGHTIAQGIALGEGRVYDKTSRRQLAERIKSRGRAARAEKS